MRIEELELARLGVSEVAFCRADRWGIDQQRFLDGDENQPGGHSKVWRSRRSGPCRIPSSARRSSMPLGAVDHAVSVELLKRSTTTFVFQ